ncbi:exported protein of unknown function [Nitrosotalea devaniterrae]|uniref:Uncharacterized protein n=1 Tax=Nitrosotalea devaniterrae TaxID=1078905 RepID=A0A128A2P1_9ARCH|nr:exported protein of unknown function [Candidatus Nitrosotalea devanaterra]
MKYLLVLFLGIIIVPALAQNAPTNQTDYQKFTDSIKILQSEHKTSDTLAFFYAIITFMAGTIIVIVISLGQKKQSDKIQKLVTQTVTQQNEISKLIGRINKFEEEQKIFLNELEKTRTARISFYGSKLITDFQTIQKYFVNVEKLPVAELQKMNPTFFAKFGFSHVITLNVNNENVEIPNIQFFNVMKQDLQVIESDLPPEVSYFAGTIIELAQLCFIPMNGNVDFNNELWKKTKQDVETAIGRLDSLVVVKKSLKDYEVKFVRSNVTIRFD